MTMEVKQRRIAIIDSRQERHELLQKRLGPSFDYDDYTKGGDAFGQLCHDNADIDMVFVGDDLMDTDAMGMLFMMRKQGFDNIDAVLILDDADQAKECTRRDDTAVRLGGDEFLLFYNFDTVPDTPVQRLFDRLKEENQKSDIPLSISCGITTILLSGRDYERLYQDADRALYEAKEAGRGCCKIYTEEMK